jgi:hypothetical protein
MQKLGQWFRAFPWGEGSLWMLFIFTGFIAASESSETSMTLAGLFLLAAIGVRATRLPKSKNDDHHA